MADVSEEVKANYLALTDKTVTTISDNIASFKGKKALLESYARLATLNAIKLDLIEGDWSEPAKRFFEEAHNDAMLSHLNASFGSWRPALQSMRSFLENTMMAIYYSEHPVELLKWERGDHRIEPRDLREYVASHPVIALVASDTDLKKELDSEYRDLSAAVHGSKSIFRMTNSDGKPNLAETKPERLGKWAARERATVNLCVLMLASFFNQGLDGAKRQPMRDSMRISLSKKSKAALKKHFNVRIGD